MVFALCLMIGGIVFVLVQHSSELKPASKASLVLGCVEGFLALVINNVLRWGVIFTCRARRC